jgi:isopentenyldiphosphate isomerase
MPELFDVYDEAGNWTGTAERKEVHRRGLWHHTVHCWLVRPDERTARVLFQQRAPGKDTNPGCFDITAAGHLEAGESPRDVLRELEEELGVQVSFDQLVPFGIVREHASGSVNGVPFVDAEISHVFGLVSPLSLQQFQLQESEVSGLYEADADELIALMGGRLERIQAVGVKLREDELRPTETSLTRDSFVPRDYRYYVDVFTFLKESAAAKAQE